MDELGLKTAATLPSPHMRDRQPLHQLVAATPARGWKEHTHKMQFTHMALELVKLSTENRQYSPEIWLTTEDLIRQSDNPGTRYAYAQFIEQGAWDEDFPVDEGPTVLDRDVLWYGITLNCRANNHYRHALSGRGLSDSPFVGLDDEDVDCLTWARTNPSFRAEEEFGEGKQWKGFYQWTGRDVDGGNMSWERAVNRYGYHDSSKQLAYYTLGFVLHLLQDMGCPEHVHDDPPW